MSMATDAYAPWIGLAFLAIAIAIRLAWRAKWRRDDRRTRALAAGIDDEKRLALTEPTADYEPCDHTWPAGDDSWIHPPADHRCTRLPGGHRRHVCRCGVEDEPSPLLVVEEDTQEFHVDEPVTRIYVEPGYVMFRGGLVHTACLEARLRDAPPCAGCAVHLDHVLTGAS